MDQLLKFCTRWAIVSCSPAIFVLLFTSCATVPSSQKYVGSIFNSKEQARESKSFPVLWEKRTVQFGAEPGLGRVGHFGTSFLMIGGEGHSGGSGEFPLQIAATLMDSSLIDAGLQHYATILAMSPEEYSRFHSAYYGRYNPTTHLLVWCELQTIWAENYLDPHRWIIFLEDDAGNQYEPVRVLEESPPISPMLMERWSGFQPGQQGRGWSVHQKALMLCFPKRDIYGTPILSEKLMFLKLVFQLKEGEGTRAEGVWVFKR